MNIRNISDVNAFIADSSQYRGEIFVNISNETSFSDVKSFLDTNNLIAFIPSENAIYAQNHKYKGITDEQLSSLSTFATNITELQNKLAIVDPENPTDHDSQSIIGTLTYGSGQDQITSTNITQFITNVLSSIEAGSSTIGNELEEINSQITAINTKLAGINGTVKDYVDNSVSNLNTTLSQSISDLATMISSVNTMVARGDYATRVTADNNDAFIEVELVATAEENEGVTSMVPPYTYKVKSKNTIASKSDLQQLETSLQNTISTEIANILGEGNINASYDTIKEIADWIINHPDSTQIVSDINLLKQKVNDLLGEVTYEEEDPDTHEIVTKIKKFSTGTLSGTNWATSLEDVNEILSNVSFAQGVENNAEANKINGLDFAQQDASSLTGDSTDTQVQFGSQSLDPQSKESTITLNTTLLSKIKQNTLTLAAADAQTKATTALNSAKAYTDEKIAWLVL
jgi:predicted nucleotidyltransferase